MYKEYCKQDFYVFPCNDDKTPQTFNGFKGAALSWENWTGDLIGLPTGNKNNIVVIDLDIKDGFPLDILIDELKSFGNLPATYTVKTPSGGIHLYYKTENTSITVGTRYFDKKLPIDIRGNGGYVIAADNVNYMAENDITDILSKCAPLPVWVENFKIEKEKTSIKSTLPISEIQEIRSALSYIDSDDRDAWVKLGMALYSTGDASARGLWDEWSQKSDKYNPADQERTWRSFKPSSVTIASVFYEAEKHGWKTTYKTTEIIEPEKNKITKRKFPVDLLNPPGVVGDLIKYINYKSIKEQPVLSLGAALCAIGTLQGRKIQTETGIRTNIYCIGVGESGSGKEAARSAIKEVFHYSGVGHMASVEDLASDSAIVTSIESSPSQIFLLDEIGRFLRVTNTDTKNPHLFNVISVLLKLYGSANQMFYGKSYADRDKKKQIDNPNLCIYGTTVPSVLYQGLTAENITDGFLSRVMLFESEDPDPIKDRTKNFLSKPPPELLQKLKQLRDLPTNYNGGVSIDPRVVQMTDTARNILYKFEDDIRNFRIELRKKGHHESIYNRTSQTAEQIALVIAGGVDFNNPVVDESIMNYGIKLAKHLSDNLLYIVDNHISSNEIESDVKKVFEIIKSNNGVSMSELTRKTQGLPGYKRKDIIETLEQGGRIIETLEGDGKRKKKVFYIQ